MVCGFDGDPSIEKSMLDADVGLLFTTWLGREPIVIDPDRKKERLSWPAQEELWLWLGEGRSLDGYPRWSPGLAG